MSSTPLKEVTRWTPVVIDEGRREGIPDELMPLYIVHTLAAIDRESDGNPDAVNPKSGATGLTQQIPRYYADSHNADVRTHIGAQARVIAKFLTNTGGHIPTAMWAFGSGPGTVAGWVSGTKDYPWTQARLEYWAEAQRAEIPAYSAWYNSWAAAGFPVSERTITRRDGRTETYKLAEHVPVTSSPFASSYNGKYCWNGKCRTYEGKPDIGTTTADVALPQADIGDRAMSFFRSSPLVKYAAVGVVGVLAVTKGPRVLRWGRRKLRRAM